MFLANGSRLYLDVGSHPEYATAECDDLAQLVAHDKAGERILHNLAVDAQSRLEAEGVEGRIHLFKNNLDSAGNSYGCHENYLIRRRSDFARTAEVLVPFLITRQILTGSGHVLVTSRGPIYTFSQRADHLWEATSSATTRSRPIINTRDEPHADAEEYRRLHVISGDSSMSQTTTMLKVGMTDLMLRMIEAGVMFRDFTPGEPGAGDPGDQPRPVGERTGPAGPRDADERAGDPERLPGAGTRLRRRGRGARPARRAGARAVGARAAALSRAGDPSCVDTELDWAIKKRLMDRYRSSHDVPLSDPRVRRLDLAYHDISPTDGLFARLVDRGLAATVVDEATITDAVETPPQTTRAKLRGDFVRAATSRRRDYTVDWVHLKINDQAGRTVLCKDPFRSEDPRVDRLIAGLEPGEPSLLGTEPVGP